MTDRVARRRAASPAPPAGGDAASEEPPVPRVLRTVFQRRSAEEQSLRRAALSELVRLSNEPMEDGRRWTGADSSPVTSSEASANLAPSPSPCSTPEGGLGAAMRKPMMLPDGPLRFSASFECGNLLSAKLVAAAQKGGGGSSSSTAFVEIPNELEYELLMDGDTQSAVGHTQWFYFSVKSRDFTGRVTFRLVNMRKKKSLYQCGLQPHVFSVRRNKGWEPFSCEEIMYTANTPGAKPGRPDNSGGRADQHTLTFTYQIDGDDELYFAGYPPYTYSMLNHFLAQLEDAPEARPHFQRFELSRSIGQLPVPLLVVAEDIGLRSPAEGDAAFDPNNSKRPSTARAAIAVIARQHPGEVVGSWAVQGFLKFLLGPTPAAQRLRAEFVFHVVPMVNVDGVVHGNSRCTLAGIDPNRVWHDPNPIIHPVIFALKNHLKNVAQGTVPPSMGGPIKSIEMFLDFHGHSAKFGCFFYGSCPTAPISNALFPKLCAIASKDMSFEQSHWRCPRSHRKTARYVVFKQLGVKYAYTMECSLFAPVSSSIGLDWEVATDEPNVVSFRKPPRAHFSPNRVEWIGVAVGRAAAAFFNVDRDCRGRGCSRGYVLMDGDEGSEEESEQPLLVQGEATSSAQGDSSEANAPPAPPQRCDCSESEFLPDLCCPKALSCRPWLQLTLLESSTPAEVLEGLTQLYGDVVPDLSRSSRGDGSDDGGDSDGDDVPEPPDPAEKAQTQVDSTAPVAAAPAAAAGQAQGQCQGAGTAAAASLPAAAPTPTTAPAPLAPGAVLAQLASNAQAVGASLQLPAGAIQPSSLLTGSAPASSSTAGARQSRSKPQPQMMGAVQTPTAITTVAQAASAVASQVPRRGSMARPPGMVAAPPATVTLVTGGAPENSGRSTAPLIRPEETGRAGMSSAIRQQGGPPTMAVVGPAAGRRLKTSGNMAMARARSVEQRSKSPCEPLSIMAQQLANKVPWPNGARMDMRNATAGASFFWVEDPPDTGLSIGMASPTLGGAASAEPFGAASPTSAMSPVAGESANLQNKRFAAAGPCPSSGMSAGGKRGTAVPNEAPAPHQASLQATSSPLTAGSNLCLNGGPSAVTAGPRSGGGPTPRNAPFTGLVDSRVQRPSVASARAGTGVVNGNQDIAAAVRQGQARKVDPPRLQTAGASGNSTDRGDRGQRASRAAASPTSASPPPEFEADALLYGRPLVPSRPGNGLGEVTPQRPAAAAGRPRTEAGDRR